jgi:histidinol-phosphate aminotransferase
MSAAVAAVLADINRYPDREAVQLRSSLAGYVGRGITPDGLWPANGSNEVMVQILGAFAGPGRSLLSLAPTYSMYPVYARDTMTRYRVEPRRADHRIDFALVQRAVAADPPSVTIVASPNNPTGTPLEPDEVRRLHALVAPAGVLVVDEAYGEFAQSASALDLLGELDRLIVVRTLSKAFGLAGLRLGYAVTSSDIVDALRIVRLPYHLSATTQAAATAALQHAADLLAPVAEVIAERDSQASWLRGRGVAVAESQANFLLVGPLADAHGVFRGLLKAGVLVRETAVPGCLRVSIGTPAENKAFRQAFDHLTPRNGKAP